MREDSLTKADLIQYIKRGCKGQSAWKIGVEHEKFLFTQKRGRATYIKHIQPLLQDLANHEGWQPLTDQNNIIGLKKGGAAISLEPGGQLELSGAPLSSLLEVKEELQNHFAVLQPYLEKYGLTVALKGYDPTPLKKLPLMPKQRYKIMAPYMAKKGSLGQEMMFNTCTVQVNLDFQSEEDMIKKFRVAVALQSVATALFAHSPLTDTHHISYQSYRRHIWTDTDPDRCGLPLFVFDADMGFEKYVDFALKVPMYFIIRQGQYINMAGLSFSDFMKGKLPFDYHPTLADWGDHLTTIFTEVRLKTYLEMRGADAGPLPYLIALPSFWVGLLYHQPTLDQAYTWIQTWSIRDMEEMANSVARHGIIGLKDIASQALDLASQGVRAYEPGAQAYLDPLFQRL